MRGTLLANRRGIQRFRQMAITAVKSSNIKLLLFGCIALTLVMAATRASDFMGWTIPSDSLDQFLPPGKINLFTRIDKKVSWSGLNGFAKSKEELYAKELNDCGKFKFRGSKFEHEPAEFDLFIILCMIIHFVYRKGYAIVMNTWKRYDLLKQSISHYSSCPGLESIHIVWSEPNPPSDSLSKFLNHVIESKTKGMKKVELSFDINTEDSLNNRFKEIPGLKTDAVFSIDDDVIFPCSSVEFAFKVWQSAPNAMVGFVPRAHWVDKTLGKKDYYTYGGWWSVWCTGTYSMVLSKAAFFHKKYLRMYTNEMPVSIKEFVTKNRNCEDIAMSFLVANATGAPPIWVKGGMPAILLILLMDFNSELQLFYENTEICCGLAWCSNVAFGLVPLSSCILTNLADPMERSVILGKVYFHPVNNIVYCPNLAYLLMGKIFEIGSTGISSLGGHVERRTRCINRFAAEFGRMPLVPTTAKAVDSRNTWFW
ncbi:hypothetical protein SADUNF_Sadunf08G0052600 [Salix dunnii]|uniref:Glycosyl transferase 64 domain-containing protein n=1 Tax=Salix dunnii TaxID=1413687 RepID=A0A835MXC2_9ROSI|nr:hypothetical protein SADUNF_Sadunf08G0052600 [Salix dunnii]